MEAAGAILTHLFVIFAAAKASGEVASRLGQSPVLAELLVGILIGPYALGLIGRPDPALVASFQDEATAREALNTVYRVFSELGAIVLLFFVGLQMRLSDLLGVGWRALSVAALEVVVTFALAFGFVTLALRESGISGLFVAAALVATSVGITARVLSDLEKLNTRETRIILGAAIADDVLGLIVLAIAGAAVGDGGISAFEVIAIALQAVGFMVLVALAGTRLARRAHPHLGKLRIADAPFAVALASCLGLAALSKHIGLAAVIGAFLAGIVFAELGDRELQRACGAVYHLLVPFFFVLTGSLVDWRLLLDPTLLALALAVLCVAVAGKLIGSALGALGMAWRQVGIVSVGMVPRGEVSLVAAGTGFALGVLSDRLLSVILIVVMATTLLVPPVLRALYSGGRAEPDVATEVQERAPA